MVQALLLQRKEVSHSGVARGLRTGEKREGTFQERGSLGNEGIEVGTDLFCYLVCRSFLEGRFICLEKKWAQL